MWSEIDEDTLTYYTHGWGAYSWDMDAYGHALAKDVISIPDDTAHILRRMKQCNQASPKGGRTIYDCWVVMYYVRKFIEHGFYEQGHFMEQTLTHFLEHGWEAAKLWVPSKIAPYKEELLQKSAQYVSHV